MSAVCGCLGDADPASVRRMLDAAPYRGDRSEIAAFPGGALGYRWWGGRPGKAAGIFRAPDGALTACAGAVFGAGAPCPDPAADLDARLRRPDLDAAGAGLDGGFGAARWDPAAGTVSLLRDPFGVRSLYVAARGGAAWFATELKQLLAVPEVGRDLDLAAIHTYLTFSFVPGTATPIRGVAGVPCGTVQAIRLAGGRAEVGPARPYFALRERLDPRLADPQAAVAEIRRLGKAAVRRRLAGDRAGLYLSGGLDSASVAVWLTRCGATVEAFTLDFGDGHPGHTSERAEAEAVAAALGVPIRRVPADGAAVRDRMGRLVEALDVPFGDPVTAPHLLLADAARDAGLEAVFNGEGGDQLFGGWTSKPMVAAAAYGDLYGEETPEEQYLRSYHRFYGEEDALYAPAFREAVGAPGLRRALLAPHLEAPGARFLHRVRLADLALKGSQNILPRAERVANAAALDVRAPLFDRALAEAAFALPPDLKLHGASEKHVLKLAMRGRLPEDAIWRRKQGMGVPVTAWCEGPLREVVDGWLGEDAVRRRGLLRPERVAQLRAGQDVPGEVRRRRIGEKLWTLLMLEGWLRRFVDAPAPALSAPGPAPSAPGPASSAPAPSAVRPGGAP